MPYLPLLDAGKAPAGPSPRKTHQLSTHDELSAQLKIAQSNLTLASSHSDFLEETLRRRDSQSVPMATRQHSDSSLAPRTRAVTSLGSNESWPNPTSTRPSSIEDASLHGLGFDETVDQLGQAGPSPTMTATATAKSFFARIPSTRRTKPPPATRTESEPRASEDSFNGSVGGGSRAVALLVSEVTALKSSLSTLTTANSTLTTKCEGLEKTKNDLLDELERLSVELFQEANEMVADERKKRAKAEEEVERLTGEVVRLGKICDALRRGGDDLRPASIVLARNRADDEMQSALGNSIRHEGGIRHSLEALSPSLLPPPVPASPASPSSPVDGSSPSQRKWFAFARKASSPLVEDANAESFPSSTSRPNTNGNGQLSVPMGRIDSSASSAHSLSSAASSVFSTPYMDASEGVDARPGPDSPNSTSPEIGGASERDGGREKERPTSSSQHPAETTPVLAMTGGYPRERRVVHPTYPRMSFFGEEGFSVE
ncbi:hypothetical protein RQP46_007907 [Phenoliferia psychrophenolica]